VISVDAVITARGARMNGNAEDMANSGASAPEETPVRGKKGHVGAHRPHVANMGARSGKKATPAKKADTGRKSAKPGKKASAEARSGSKTAKVLALLKRTGGASGKELMKATGWQAHSVRGFLSGVIAKKMGMTVKSVKTETGERRYSVKA
jgi:hypothetical protein